MKINTLNFLLQWETVRDVFYNIDTQAGFPSYDVTIYDKDKYLIGKYVKLKDYEPIIEITSRAVSKMPKIKYFTNISRNRILSKFEYNFQDNYYKYKEINDKIGFYRDLTFSINYENNIDKKFDFTAQYNHIEDINKQMLFNKIYRSSDGLSIKLLINKEYFNSKDISSFLIFTKLSNRSITNKKLLNLLAEGINQKWLDINDETAMVTIPFIETDLVEMSENINIEIIPLNSIQTNIYKFLKEREIEEDINSLYKEYFTNQYFDIGKIYKQTSNNETVVFYQNYIYLFNKDSLETNSLQTDLNINGIVFNKYLPLLNKDQINKTICLSDDLNTDNVLDNNYNIQKDYLGYYAKNLIDYKDVAIDLDYLQNQGIKSVKILEIEELANTCNIYIEYITSFYSNEKFYIETSNNLKFYEKYKTTIEEKEYITLLFKYSYNLDTLDQYLLENPNFNKNKIISEKDLINFSAKLIL